MTGMKGSEANRKGIALKFNDKLNKAASDSISNRAIATIEK